MVLHNASSCEIQIVEQPLNSENKLLTLFDYFPAGGTAAW